MNEQIQAGIALLDEKAPALLGAEDWRPLINKDKLGMCWGHRCILGQLFGDYSVGLDKLGVYDRETSVRLGFTLAYPAYEWEELTEAWKEALS